MFGFFLCVQFLCFQQLLGKNKILNEFGNDKKPSIGEVIDFSAPANLNLNKVYLEGKWLGFFRSIESVSEGKIILETADSPLFILLSAELFPVEIEILLDEKPFVGAMKGHDVREKNDSTFLVVTEKRWYSIASEVQSKKVKKYTLNVPSGIQFYGFQIGAHD